MPDKAQRCARSLTFPPVAERRRAAQKDRPEGPLLGARSGHRALQRDCGGEGRGECYRRHSSPRTLLRQKRVNSANREVAENASPSAFKRVVLVDAEARGLTPCERRRLCPSAVTALKGELVDEGTGTIASPSGAPSQKTSADCGRALA